MHDNSLPALQAAQRLIDEALPELQRMAPDRSTSQRISTTAAQVRDAIEQAQWHAMSPELMARIQAREKPRDKLERFWLYAPDIQDEPLVGRYVPPQLDAPHGFHTSGYGFLEPSIFTHVKPYTTPAVPEPTHG